MSDEQQPVDDVEPPRCARAGCEAAEVVDGEPFCEKCHRAITTALRDLPELYTDLGHALAPSSGAGDERVSGSREAPLPLRAEVMALRQDMAGALADWEDSLRGTLGFTPAGRELLWTVNVAETLPVGAFSTRIVHQGYDSAEAIKAATAAGDGATLTSSRAAEPLRRTATHHPNEHLQLIYAARFLATALDKLLQSPEGATAGNEILEYRARADVALGVSRGDVTLPMPCPNPECRAAALVRKGGQDFITCDKHRGGCGATYTDIRWLLRVLAVDLPDLLLPAARVAEVVGVDRRTVHSWVRRGHLQPMGCDARSKRDLYRVGRALYLASHPTARSRRKDLA